MDIQAHTTPRNRQELRNYLRNRRLTGSLHQAITYQVLNDLDEAMRLLKGSLHPSASLAEEIQAYLALRIPPPAPDPSSALPGIFGEG